MNFNNFWSIVQYAKVFEMPNYRVIQIQDMIFWMATIPDILILIPIEWLPQLHISKICTD